MRTWTIGSDEAGYGTWAGALYIVAVALPDDIDLPEVNDSKKLSEAARLRIFDKYFSSYGEELGILTSVLTVGPKQIDSEGVYKACLRGHQEVHTRIYENTFGNRPDAVSRQIVDGYESVQTTIARWVPGNLIAMTKADAKIKAVSLASCIAKTLQCRAMDELAKKYPGFGFESHRGYGTPKHAAALKEHGICAAHRQSYAPIKAILEAGL